MKSSKDTTIFIDLSFLSTEEEGIIRQVLLRDEDLKRLEIGRVRRLRNSVPDPKQLKVLTGEWFEDLRAKRHGRQPDISAVVRSSMRWKKTAGHKPNPFLHAVTEDKDEEKQHSRTHPQFSDDSRSLHPAHSVEECRAYTDEDFALVDETHPVQSPAKNVPVEKPQKPSDKTTEKPFILRSLSNFNNPILGTPGPGSKPTDNPQYPKPPLSPPHLHPALEQKCNSAGTINANAETPEPIPNVPLPPAEQEIQSFEENFVKISTGANKIGSLERTSFSETHSTSSHDQSHHVGRAVERSNTEPEAENGRIMSSSKHAETEVKYKPSHTNRVFVSSMNGLEFEEEVAIGQSLHQDKKRASELPVGSLQGQEDSDKLLTVSSVEKMEKQVSPSDPAPQIQNERPEREKDEIPVAIFRKSSPTRMDVLSVDLNNEENASVTEDQVPEALNDLNTPDDVSLDQNRSADINIDLLTEVVVKDAAFGRKWDFDVELRDSVSTDKIKRKSKHSNEIETTGELYNREQSQTFSEVPDVRRTSEEDGRTERDILNSLKNVSPDTEVSVEVPTPTAPTFAVDVWEDEGVESEGDNSSVSSYGSDLSGRRHVSASALSVTERSGSLLSVYSDAGDIGNVIVQGSVEFALMYSPLGELVIMVEQCQDLAIANPRKQRTDPYVKTYLYPDKRSKRKTSIKKRTVNPVYVESLRYKVKREELPAKTLNLSVWHNDSRGRNVFLGQVELSLRTWDWKHEALTWYNLQPKSKDNQESQESCGLLSISLKYVPESTDGSKLSTGEIHIWLREARRLRRLKTQGVDSFVKCYMLPDTSKKSRQKTRVMKKTQDPVYNHAMVYDGFKTGEVREVCCELTVWDNNKLTNQFLGGLRLGLGTGQSYGKKVDWMDSANEEVEIWEGMLAKPNTWVEAEISLRSSMTPRK
ncbi:uncharacterized protein LOC143480513 isoform X2 [Brachyhypopomus gauderio]|uniref:uncharacterized protein LOC143480513 isoform X2 n=1 Tax=Brachyhypopomus gauderio TaxID=698409 RepID=UPI0040422398